MDFEFTSDKYLGLGLDGGKVSIPISNKAKLQTIFNIFPDKQKYSTSKYSLIL